MRARNWVVCRLSFVRSDCIYIDWHSRNIEDTTSDSFVGLSFFADSKHEPFSGNLFGIESADAVSKAHGGEVDEVHGSVNLVEVLALDNPPHELFVRGSVAAGVFPTTAVCLPSGGNAADLLDAFCGVPLAEFLRLMSNLVPQLLAELAVDHFSHHSAPHKLWTCLMDFLTDDDFKWFHVEWMYYLASAWHTLS